jgi:hypothetical protein
VFFCLSKLAPAFPGVPSRSLFPRGACCVRVGVGHRAQDAAFSQVRDLWRRLRRFPGRTNLTLMCVGEGSRHRT